ncbi:MAG: class I SAM-dependent methyltransferase [Nocardioidaceae bacterium]|nr:class I SAM-dependent methyltransferase [Nocardioidaceae bacterium]
MAAAVTDEYVVVPRRIRGPVVVSFDDAYIWSFVPERDGSRSRGGWRVRWPELLEKRLSGTTQVRLERDGTTLYDESVTFRGEGAPLQLRDQHGHPLAIDKMGHLTRVFSETDDHTRAQVVEGTRRALADLREDGFDAHLSYGCLLGAVRNGKMIGHDSDADLAYYSEHTTPADIIRESYAMERAMRRRGWRLVRMSGADLKLFHKLDDGRDVQIDIFGAFHVSGVFYELGARSGRLPRAAVTPASSVVLEGVELAAPADPEAVLEFLYGPSWRVPDPAFQAVDPPEGIRRLDGWLRGFRSDVIAWNELLRYRSSEVPWRPSEAARWAHQYLGEGAPLADLGCGNGRDTVWLANVGHPVRAYDFAGTALRQTRRRLDRAGITDVEVATLSLNDRRSVLVTGAELARAPEPVNLYARGLVGCLNAEARDLLVLLGSMALRRGGVMMLEFAATGVDVPAEPADLVQRVDPDEIAALVEQRGGTVELLEVTPGQDFFDQPDPRVARLVARWGGTSGSERGIR